MTITVGIEALFILHTLRKAGFEAYLVGGAVRDILMEVPKVTDYDFTTNATPEEIMSLFPEGFYENQFGTVMITPADLRTQMGLATQTHVDAPTQSAGQKQSLPTSAQTTARPNRIIDIAEATKIHVSLQKSAQRADSPSPQKTQLTNGEKNYEITTYRTDGQYRDFRRPEVVTWGKTLEEDLERRDFTINAMAITVPSEVLENIAKLWQQGSDAPPTLTLQADQYSVIDPYGGRDDLANRFITTVGDAHARFSEDALRMLRAVRFSVQLGFDISPEIERAIQEHARLITHISWERIRDEFLKMIASKYPKVAIELLDRLGLLEYILPEILTGKGVAQGGHHTTDVWTHSLDALAECPSSDAVVRLATLLHDVAKPQTLQIINGQPTFYNHEIVGSRVAKKIAERLRLSKKDQDRVFALVRYHMFHYQPYHTDAAIRRFMRRVELENIDDILDLREADRLGSGARKTSWRLEEMKERMIEQLHQPMDVTDLAVTGTDLIEELELKPGPIFRDILQRLLEKVIDEPELNTQETLLEEARKIIAEEKNSL